MGGRINTSYDYNTAMEAIRAEVVEYCESQGIDPDVYLNNLDENLTTSVMDIPSLESYFQLAYMQLMEIINPQLIASLEAQVGEVDFDTLYEHADDDLNNLITSLIEDDPELMALFAHQAAGQSEAEFLLNHLAELNQQSDQGQDESFTDDARNLADQFNFGPGFDWIIEKEDMFNAASQSIVERLASLDQAYAALISDFQSGNIDETTLNSEMQNISYARESLMVMLQQVSEFQMNFFEMVSQIFNKYYETQQSLISRLTPA